MPRASVTDLTRFATDLLVAKGVKRPDARYMAELAVTTEAGGVSTHGISILGYYDNMIPARIDPAARPRVVRQSAASALIDVNRSFAQLAMRLAQDLALRKVRKTGVAMIAVRNGSWLAALGTPLIPLARAGYFAQLWAQSSQCQDSAPYGGTQARFSTNPVAFAFPSPNGPVIADFSTSAMSMGKAGRLARAGKKTSEKAFYDKRGRLTNDPRVMLDGGAMLLAGGLREGYKGYALALWSEALTAMAGGSCNNPAAPQQQSFNLTVIDPRAFERGTWCKREIGRMVRRIKTSRRAKGVDRIRLPGERFREQLALSRKRGVALSHDQVQMLDNLARKHALKPVRTRSRA